MTHRYSIPTRILTIVLGDLELCALSLAVLNVYILCVVSSFHVLSFPSCLTLYFHYSFGIIILKSTTLVYGLVYRRYSSTQVTSHRAICR